MSGIDSLFHDRVVHDYSHTSEQVIVVYISSEPGTILGFISGSNQEILVTRSAKTYCG